MANIINQYGQVKLGVRYTLAPLTSSYLLDTYTGAAAAYSLRKLSNTYSGAAIRVRRSSDDTTLDVGFNADGTLNTTALTTFVGSGNGFVSIWYDQSGNGKNATQPASANQPYIIVGGALQTLNGKPSLYFDGASRYLDCGYLNGGTKASNFSTFISANFTAVNQNRTIFSSMDAGGNGKDTYNTFGIHSATPTPYQMFGGAGGGIYYKYWRTSNVPTQSLPYLFEQHYKSNISPFMGTFYWNNTAQSTTEWFQGSSTISGGPEFKTSIGRSGENNGGYHQGFVQEIATYFSDQMSNRSGIVSNINLYYSIYPTDVDAQAFITAAAITNTTQQSAINTLVTDLKTANIWTKMKAIYPFVGGTAAQHRFNLKDPRAVDAAYYLTFNGGGTHSATGYLPNGNSYANTKLNPRTALGATSAHFSYYSRNATTSTSQNYVMGADDASGFNALILRNNSKYFRYTINNSAFEDAGLLTTSSTSGFFIGTQDGTNVKLFRNNTNIAQNTGSDVRQEKVNLPIFIGADNNNGSASDYTTAESAFASIGDGLTDTEATAFYNAVANFNTTLSRAV